MHSREFAATLPDQLPGITDTQLQLAADAYERKPTATGMALVKAQAARMPTAYFVAVCVRIVDENPPPRARAQRHDLDQVACRDCADTGFVTLKMGDAAPCHCAIGVEKQRKLGTVHYGSDDYDPVVSDTEPITLVEYAQTEAGKTDPHLEAMRALWKKQRILKNIEP